MATATSPHHSASESQAYELAPVLSQRYAVTWTHLATFVLFGTLFLYLNYLPLFHTDIWCHVSHGQWILEHGSLPLEEPFMPLAEGMRDVHTAWLSQVVLGWIDQVGGPAWLSNTFAIVLTLTYMVLARVFYLQTRSIGLSLIGVLIVLGVGWSRQSIIRPEVFGTLCFATLLWLMARGGGLTTWQAGAVQGDVSRSRLVTLWLGVPLVMAAWANLHGSFPCGLALLGCVTVGRMLEVVWQQRSLRAVFGDRGFQRWLMVTELGLAATLLNPQGVQLWINVLTFSGNANLTEVMEWYPLVLKSATGIGFAATWIVLLILLRHSRERVRPSEVLALGIFSILAIMSVRMIGWYAAVVTVVMMPHLANLWLRIRLRRRVSMLLQRRSWKLTLCCLLTCWLTFALSDVSRPLLGGKPKLETQLFSRQTPSGLTEYLRANPPEGQIWNSQTFGDWLVREGPPGLQVFMTSYIHLAPRQVWRDYLRVFRAQAGWDRVLEKYRVGTIVVDKAAQRQLISVVRRDTDWRILYEDDQSMVFRRVKRLAPRPSAEIPLAEA